MKLQSPALKQFVESCKTLPLHKLPAHLRTFPRQWPFPRGDLNNWISALNRFDDILESFTKTYGLTEGPQTVVFGRQLLLSGLQDDRQVDDAILTELGFAHDGDRLVVEEVLEFSCLLIDSCANRRFYASGHHLDALLNTTSLSLLNKTLSLALRLAQKYARDRIRAVSTPREPAFLPHISHSVLSQHYSISLDKIQKLALPLRWGLKSEAKRAADIKETEQGTHVTPTYASDLVSLLRDDEPAAERIDKFGQPYFSLFVPGVPSNTGYDQQPSPSSSTQSPNRASNPASPTGSASGVAGSMGVSKVTGRYELIEVPAQEVLDKPLEQIVREYIVKFPKECQFEFLCRLRASKALCSGSYDDRVQIIESRLLAVGNYLNLFPESQHHLKIFQLENGEAGRNKLANQLCDLLHTSRGDLAAVPKPLQSLALTVLEAYTNHNKKTGEVMNAVGANVNHGVLTYVVRKAARDTSDDSHEETPEDREYARCLFSLLHSLPRTHPRAAEGFAAAGILESFVEVLKMRTGKAQSNFPQILTFLDVFIFNIRDAFNTLVNAQGLDILSDFVQHEVAQAFETAKRQQGVPSEWKSPVVDYHMSFLQLATFKSLFKLLKNMMAINGGTFDRLLRNLIESAQLLEGLRRVVETPAVFGSSVWCGAVEIFSNFIHNEPTSYAAIAEAGLTKAFLATINCSDPEIPLESDSSRPHMPPPTTMEAISIIPLAFSAICLNENGMRQLVESKALDTYFRSLLQPQYTRALLDAIEDHHRGNRRMEVQSLGAQFDELARHHPNLKPTIVKLVVAMVESIHQHVLQWRENAKTGPLIHNETSTESAGPVDFARSAVNNAGDVEMEDADRAPKITRPIATMSEPDTSVILGKLRAMSEILLGFFGNTSLFSPFLDEGGAEKLVNILTTPIYQYDSSIQQSQPTFARVIQIFIQQKPHIMIPLLLDRVQGALTSARPLMEHGFECSFFTDLNHSKSNWTARNAANVDCLKALVTIRNTIGVLTASLLEPTSRNGHNPLTCVNVGDLITEIASSLTKVQRSAMWENLLLGDCDWDQLFATTYVKDDAENNQSIKPNNTQSQSPNTTAGDTDSSRRSLSEQQPISDVSSRKRTLNRIRLILSNFANDISQFLNAVAKAIVPRRLPSDSFLKSKIFSVTASIADSLKRSLEVPVPEVKFPKVADSYRRAMVVLVLSVMIDKRTDTHSQFLTLTVWQFRKAGGVDALLEIGNMLTTTEALINYDGGVKLIDQSPAGQALRNLFSFFTRASSNRIVSDALQTQSLHSRADRDLDSGDSYSNPQFLVDMRFFALRFAQPIWDSDAIGKLPSELARHTSTILQNCLDASNESGAHRRKDKAPPQGTVRVRKYRPRHEDAVGSLVEKGFDPGLAQEALYRCCDNSASAQEYCAARTRNLELPRFPIPAGDLPDPPRSTEPDKVQETVQDGSQAGEAHAGLSNPAAGATEGQEAVSQLFHPTDIFSNSSDSSDVRGSNAETSDSHNGQGIQQSSDPPAPVEGPIIITIDDLDEVRSDIRGSLVDRCLNALNSFSDLSFELADLLMSSVSKAQDANALRADIAKTLFHCLLSLLQSDDIKNIESRVASSAHLLGVVLQNHDFYHAAREDLKENVDNILPYLSSEHQGSTESKTWLSNIFLVLEKMLYEDLQPRSISWDIRNAEEPIPDEPAVLLQSESVTLTNKENIFRVILDTLTRVGKDDGLATACLRVLVCLTRWPAFAHEMVQKQNMRRLFMMMRQLSNVKDSKTVELLMIILRQIVEDDATIRRIIENEIQGAMEKRNSRGRLTISSLLREHFELALRAPETFVQVCNQLLTFSRLDRDGRNPSEQQLILKRDQPSIDEIVPPQTTANTDNDQNVVSTHDQQTTDTNQSPVAAANADAETRNLEARSPFLSRTDGVTSFLLSELLTFKDVKDNPQKEPATNEKAQDSQGDVEMSNTEPRTSNVPNERPHTQHTDQGPQQQQPKQDEHPIFVYRCLIMQCLTELLQSYNICKLNFIGYSRRTEPLSVGQLKPHSGVLNYLLRDLIAEHSSQVDELLDKEATAVRNWAMNVLTGLCARTSDVSPATREEVLDTDKDSDLSYVRRFVLEHAIKAYKETSTSTEIPTESKFSQLHGYAHLFSSMLVGKPNSRPSGHDRGPGSHEIQKQMAKVMFEKHFVPTMTASLTDIESRGVESMKALKCILQTMKTLTSAAHGLSLTGSISNQAESDETDEIMSASSASASSGDQREETPDLFRNSTLGMFDPGRADESEGSSSQDDEEDEMYGDAYADDMDFDDEVADHADDEVVSEEEDGAGEMGPIEGVSGDIPMEVEIEYDEDGDESSSSEEEEDDDDDEEGVIGEEEDSDLEHEEDEIEAMEHEMEDDDEISMDEQDADEAEWQDEDEVIDFDDDQLGGEAGVTHGIVGHIASSTDRDIDLPVPDPIDVDILEDGGDTPSYEEDYEGGNLHDDPEEQDSEGDEHDFDGDEEEDFDDDEFAVRAPGFVGDDTDIPPLPWQWPGGSRARLHGHLGHHDHHHHHRQAFAPLLQDMDHIFMPELRSQRPAGGPRTPEDTQGANPLLNRNRRQPPDLFPQPHNLPRSAQRGSLGVPPAHLLADLSRSIQEETFGFDRAMLDRVLQTALGQGGALSIQMQDGRGHPIYETRHFIGNPPPRPMPPSADRDDPNSSVAFEPATTSQRWQEAARMLFGPDYTGKAGNLTNSMLCKMAPPAIERERILKDRREEQERIREEEEAKLQAEREAREAQEKKEREEQEAKEAAEREAAEAEAARLAAASAAQEVGTDAETMDAEAMEGVEPSQVAEAHGDTTASGSDERVVTSIRGRSVDITHLGIDTAYLEALPEEIREEVIMQQAAEQRSSTAAAGGEPSTIDSEFLDALPQDIREELLQQEAQDRRRREREEARRQVRAEGGPPQPEDIDPASLIASLDPMLRQQVLAESDEDMLAALPPEMAAEARALGGHRRRAAAMPPTILGNGAMPPFGNRGDPTRDGISQARADAGIIRPPHRHPIVRMLDKSGVAGLLRLMLMPMLQFPRNNLNAVLLSICGNRQTRGEVINGLLSILQDGCADAAAVDRCFSQLTVKAKQQSPPKSPQKRNSISFTPAENGHVIVIDQCLGALGYIAQAVPHIPHYFITEHDTVGGSRTKTSRKGKAKESKANRYPFMSLIALLERESVINNSNTLDTLSGLLASVTQPLSVLAKREDRDKVNGEIAQNQPAASQEQETGNAAQQTAAAPSEQASETVSPVNASQQEPQSSTSAAESSAVVVPLGGEGNNPQQASSTELPTDNTSKKENKRPRSVSVPDLPAEALKPAVNMVLSRECNSKIFQNAIATLTSLSVVEGAKDVFRAELIAQARTLAQSIQARLAKLSGPIKAVASEIDAQSMALAELSPTGSDQTKFHRILTALDYLFQSSTNGKGPDQNDAEKTQDELMELYEEPSFMAIWNRLSDVLTSIKRSDNAYFFNVATILLSLIESLMLVCKRIPLGDTTLTRRLTGQSGEPRDMRAVFFSFTNQHRKILNDLVRHNPKLMSNNFSVLIKNPGILEFDNKRNYFTRRLHHRSGDVRHYPHPSLQLHVRREQVFLDSYKHLHYKSAQEIKYGKFNIRFHNEEGVDAGGVTREWFQVLARQMFNPDYALFNPVASDRTTFHPNSLSWINQEHLSFFKFIGRIIGKALYENRVLDCHFSRAVYKKILGQPVSIKDMETVDLEYSKNMQWMLTNDITDIITETFSIVVDKFGVEEVIDLIPNGRNIPVTEENKEEYVRKVIEYRLTGSVQEQLDSFLQGFYDIVPTELISVFDEGELELLISGMPDVDVDDWRANTDYHTYTASSPQIQWFWRAVRSFDKEERARLLQFVTGTGKVPLNGFKELEGMNGFTRFSIHKDYGSHDRLPSSHTCFNQLDLPEYDGYEQLRKNLYIAMTTGNEHFGFA